MATNPHYPQNLENESLPPTTSPAPKKSDSSQPTDGNSSAPSKCSAVYKLGAKPSFKTRQQMTYVQLEVERIRQMVKEQYKPPIQPQPGQQAREPVVMYWKDYEKLGIQTTEDEKKKLRSRIRELALEYADKTFGDTEKCTTTRERQRILDQKDYFVKMFIQMSERFPLIYFPNAVEGQLIETAQDIRNTMIATGMPEERPMAALPKENEDNLSNLFQGIGVDQTRKDIEQNLSGLVQTMNIERSKVDEE